mgnify:CR=1 FL=1
MGSEMRRGFAGRAKRLLGVAIALAAGLVLSAGSQAATIHVGSLRLFSTPEGLDTQGAFTYAWSLGDDGSEGFDAGDNADGERVIGGLDFAAYSTSRTHANVDRASFDDAELETMVGTVGYGPSVDIDLPVTPDLPYRLQMIFWESYWEESGLRVFDINVEGGSIEVEDLDPFAEASATGAPDSHAVLYTYENTAADDNVDIFMTASTDNVILSGLTLEALPEPGAGSLLIAALLGILARRKSSSRRVQ